MTHNQIDFQTLKENQRHNLEMESQGRNVLSETARHNQVFEQETNRANLAGEAIKRANLAETNRTNLANEAIKRDTLSETARSNLAQEALKRQGNILNYTLGMSNLTETTRHNVNVEDENVRHNKKVEDETNRHNVEGENQAAFKNLSDYEIGKMNAEANLTSANANAINADVNKDLSSSVKAKNWGSAINSVSNAINTGVKTLGDAFTLVPKVGKLLISGGK